MRYREKCSLLSPFQDLGLLEALSRRNLRQTQWGGAPCLKPSKAPGQCFGKCCYRRPSLSQALTGTTIGRRYAAGARCARISCAQAQHVAARAQHCPAPWPPRHMDLLHATRSAAAYASAKIPTFWRGFQVPARGSNERVTKKSACTNIYRERHVRAAPLNLAASQQRCSGSLRTRAFSSRAEALP